MRSAPTSLSRRRALRTAALGAAAFTALPLLAQPAPKAVRIGYQKFNTLNILKGTGQLEKALAPSGVQVEWREFLGGGQLSEALAAGAIDVGHASDGIGIFQQASGKGLAYLAAESPYPGGVGFLVPQDSPIQSVRDLKGKRVATGRGYNSQYLLIRALEAQGLRYEDVEAVYIVTASDTVAALESKSVAAIGLWDPFLAGAQVATGARLLFDGSGGLTGNRTYHFAKPEWARAQQATLRTLFAELHKTNTWAQGHPKEVVDLLAPQLKVDPKVLALATERRQYGVVPLTAEIAKEQQLLGDAFAKIKLIPQPVQVQDAFLPLPILLMPNHAADTLHDVIVIGLGALGAATLRPLAEAGARVLGLDRFVPPHELGSSHGESRITRLAIGEGDAYVPLVRRSHEIWRELERHTGREIYTASGGLILAPQGRVPLHHGKPDFVRRTIASAERFGIAHEVLDAAEIRRRFPPFALEGDEVGYWEPEAGFVRPEAAIAAHLERARAAGADVRTGEAVQGLEERADGTVDVVSTQGRYRAQQVVVAAGAWLPGFLGQQARTDWARDFGVYRQVMYWFDTGDAAPQFDPQRFPIFIWMYGDGQEDYMYGFPSADPAQPALKVATEQYADRTTPEAVLRTVGDDEVAAMHASRIAGRFPSVRARALQAKACLYTVTPDRDFVIDRLDGQKQVWIASACSGHGFKHSAGLGEALAHRLLERPGAQALVAPFARRAAASGAA